MVHLKGIPLSPGLARGRAFVYSDILENQQAVYAIDDGRIESEWQRIRNAREEVKEILIESADRIRNAMSKELGDIFLAQLSMLADPQLNSDLENALRNKRINAERVVELVFQEWSRTFRTATSLMLAQRADDIEDLLRRMLGVLTGVHAHRLESLPHGTILVSRRLLPSDTVFLSSKSCVAILLVHAGPTAHATILAGELGIPCLGGLPNALMGVATGDEILVNGNTGLVAVNPGRKAVRDFEDERKRLARQTAVIREKRFERAVTVRGKRVKVMANVSSRDDVERAVESGADGIGLFRTEGFFLAARNLPTAEEFGEYLGKCLEPLGEKAVNLRLLDIGGDKNLPYLNLPGELNPFLGRRGIRLLFAFPILMQIQIEAMLLASRKHRVRILAPMITFPSEMARFRTLAKDAAAKIGIQLPPLGAMVETPAAALSVAELRKHADFLCIGSNDLTQYVMAADRESALVSEYFQDGHAAIFRLLKMIAEEAGEIPVTLCGELAAKSAFLPRILAAGIHSLSVAATRVPEMKEAVRSMKRK